MNEVTLGSWFFFTEINRKCILRETIRVSPRAILAVRFGAWAMIIVVVLLLGPVSQCCSDFDEQTSAGTWLRFYLIVGIFMAGFLAWAFVLWSRVPPGAKEGYIEINDVNIFYQVGPYKREVSISEVAYVEPVVFVDGKRPAALWLSFNEDGPGARSQLMTLQRRIRKKPATPIEGRTWLVLPLVLFDRDDVEKAVNLITALLSTSHTDAERL